MSKEFIDLNNSRTKVELESDKTKIESELSILQTKAGADAFIAARHEIADRFADVVIPKTLPTGRISMSVIMAMKLNELNERPTEIVTAEITKLDKQITELSAKIKEADDGIGR